MKKIVGFIAGLFISICFAQTTSQIETVELLREISIVDQPLDFKYYMDVDEYNIVCVKAYLFMDDFYCEVSIYDDSTVLTSDLFADGCTFENTLCRDASYEVFDSKKVKEAIKVAEKYVTELYKETGSYECEELISACMLHIVSKLFEKYKYACWYDPESNTIEGFTKL